MQSSMSSFCRNAQILQPIVFGWRKQRLTGSSTHTMKVLNRMMTTIFQPLQKESKGAEMHQLLPHLPIKMQIRAITTTIMTSSMAAASGLKHLRRADNAWRALPRAW